MRIGIGGLLTVGLAVAGSSVAPAQETALSGAWTLNAPEGDWVSAGRDYGLQRYSPLKQITTANVQNLKATGTASPTPSTGPTAR
jgi:alcohol dehydrogenase (cytochrome c)/quinohemoprotein ethanol dehydrogenase